MIPEGQQLQQLQVLELVLFEPHKREPYLLRAPHINRIGVSCPGLMRLALGKVVQRGESISGLLALQPTLQSLSISGDAADDAAAPVVAQLTLRSPGRTG